MQGSNRQWIFFNILFRLTFNRYKVFQTYRPHIKRFMFKIENRVDDNKTMYSVT